MKKLTIRNKKIPLLAVILSAVALVIVGSAVYVQQLYSRAIQPLSSSPEIILVDIPSGFSAKAIGQRLEDRQVIKESWAFEWFVRNNSLRESLKAGTYALRANQSVEEIATVLTKGVVATDLVTFVPGSRIDQIEVELINSGFEPKEVEQALNPLVYANHPALVDKPRGASLEGYLYPDSYQKIAQTKPEDIIKASLDEMHKRLTPEVRAAVAKRGLSVHQGIILASIIEQEVPKDRERPIVSQVFQTRLRRGMLLQSDPTVLYGAINDGQAPSLQYDSEYNTYKREGLPAGPISNFSVSALTAVYKPAGTDYLYFVAGDDGTTHFSRTLEEHEEAVERYCQQLC